MVEEEIERPNKFIELVVRLGEEFSVADVAIKEPIIIGRKPSSFDDPTEAQRHGNETHINLRDENGEIVSGKVSRRAVRIIFMGEGYNITNLSRGPLSYSITEDQQNTLQPERPIYIKTERMGNFRMTLGPGQIQTQSVGGGSEEPMRVQSFKYSYQD